LADDVYLRYLSSTKKLEGRYSAPAVATVDDIDLGGYKDVSNLKDKAGKKQLKWEARQHHQQEMQIGFKIANN